MHTQLTSSSETTSIPTNPRTTRPVGYAFVDVSTPTEAERAVNELNGKNILDRKVSVQLARKPDEPVAAATPAEGEANGEGRKRGSTRGTGRARGSRAGRRGGRGGRVGADGKEIPEEAAPTNVPGQVDPLTDTTNKSLKSTKGTTATDESATTTAKAAKTPRPVRQRGPPEDGVASKTKVMVANLPYDLMEEKVTIVRAMSVIIRS